MKNGSMLNFTIGPVMSSEGVRAIGSMQVPYFRTPEFSEVMLDNEQLVMQFAHAPQGSRAVFMTGSGTASMEAVVMGMLSAGDKALVVNGGSFGERFVELCALHGVPFTEIRLGAGQALRPEHLDGMAGKGYTTLLVNIHETSTGVRYDAELLSRFCQQEGLLFVVDAISSFLADPFDMARLGADVMITGSQKALACPPGISVIVLSPKALQRVEQTEPRCMYLDLRAALKNAERGQTPFTPAVGILLQINHRLHEIAQNGGDEAEIARVARLAADFRKKTASLPFQMVAETPSNAVTSLHPLRASAFDIFTTLKDEYGIWICPNGGQWRDTIFRVGHIGHLTPGDNTTLVEALTDMHRKGLLG